MQRLVEAHSRHVAEACTAVALQKQPGIPDASPVKLNVDRSVVLMEAV